MDRAKQGQTISLMKFGHFSFNYIENLEKKLPRKPHKKTNLQKKRGEQALQTSQPLGQDSGPAPETVKGQGDNQAMQTCPKPRPGIFTGSDRGMAPSCREPRSTAEVSRGVPELRILEISLDRWATHRLK